MYHIKYITECHNTQVYITEYMFMNICIHVIYLYMNCITHYSNSREILRNIY